MLHHTNTRTGSYPIGASCPWRVIEPAALSPLARTLEAARTRPHVRARLAAEAAATSHPEPSPPAALTEEERVHVPVSGGDHDAITVGGYTVRAPGFTAASFDAALGRAFMDGLRIAATDRADMVLVSNPRTGASYTTSRRSCSCKATRPCKHIAFAVFVADILGEFPAAPAEVA